MKIIVEKRNDSDMKEKNQKKEQLDFETKQNSKFYKKVREIYQAVEQKL